MRLRIPGPTPLPPSVLAALSRQVIYHRGASFKRLLEETALLLQPLFGAKDSRPIILSASGTGGLEAALANTLTQGDKVLVLDNGHWGRRFGRLAACLGATVEMIPSLWGQPADVEALRHRLSASDSGDIIAVLVAHNDTFTGAVSDLAEIGSITRGLPALLIVDAVSSLGSMRVESDLWGLDVVVSASQKCLMSPPGLSMVHVSEKAWRRIEALNVRSEYWDLRRAREMLDKGQTTFTPSVNLIYALEEALKIIHTEGIPETYARHSNLADALRSGLSEFGLSLFPLADVASPSVGVFRTPVEIDANKVVELMGDRFETVIAGARRSKIDNSVIRLGTMGYCRADDIRLDVYQLGLVLRDLGVTVDLSLALNQTEVVLERGRVS